METKLERIAELISKKPKEKLQTLVHLINSNSLKESHKEMNGMKATGVDKITKDEYDVNTDGNIEKLVRRMKTQAYKPQPVRRVYIPKAGGGKSRPLGIPSYEDKLVQNVMSKILNVIYEPEFLNHSYGFRHGKSCHDALRAVDNIIMRHKISYVVDVDIKGFFDNVDHRWMMKFLQERIQDSNMLRLINRFLKAGVMEDGKLNVTDKGTPQGGLISPILANIYLHYVVDLWFEKIIKKNYKGEAHIIRFADDFVCCFQYKNEAKRFYSELVERLRKFSLEIEISKTKIMEFGRFAEISRKERGEGRPSTFDFLGFTHICGKTRKGYFTVLRLTSKKKLKVKRQTAKIWLKENMHLDVKVLVGKLNTKLIGHYRYYGINGNFSKLTDFRAYVIKQLYRTLNRRSQKNKYSYEEFVDKILSKFPISVPKIYVEINKPKFEQIKLVL